MDVRLERLINAQWISPPLDRLMAAASSLALWFPVLIAAVVVALCFGSAHARWCVVALALGVFISDGLVSLTLKRVTHRPRPYQAQANVREVALSSHAHPQFVALWMPLNIVVSAPAPVEDSSAERSEGRSFPSSHTMNNFCAATILGLFYRRWGWLYLGPAAVVAYSRIYVGAHWPSDVLISMPMAIAIGCVAVAVVRAARRRLDDQLSA